MTVKIGDRFESRIDTLEVTGKKGDIALVKSTRFKNLTLEYDLKSFPQAMKAGGYRQINSRNQENSTFRGTKPYLVMSKGVIVATEYDRERAREIKAQLGGKKSGVTIQRVSLVEEVR